MPGLHRGRMLAAKGLDVHVTNAGISGYTNAGMLARLDLRCPGGPNRAADRYGGGWNARRLGKGDESAELAPIAARLRSRRHQVLDVGTQRYATICSRTAFTSRREDIGW